MKITKKQLRKIIKEVTNRSSLTLEGNHAIESHIKAIRAEFYKEFFDGYHDEAMERIRSVIEEEYIKAAEEQAATDLRHSDIT